MLKDINTLLEGKLNACCAVAAAHDEDVMRALCDARALGARAILFGDVDKIGALLAKMGEGTDGFELVNTDSDEQSAHGAVQAVRRGAADFIMKGMLPTSVLLKAVLDKQEGLRTGRALSHVMFYAPPEYGKVLLITDGGMNPAPDLARKADILHNAAEMLRALGYEKSYAACVCGSEQVDEKIPATVDAKNLAEMTERWAPYNMTVYGPVGLDLAVSKEACAHKKYVQEGAGEADILLMPNYETGNGIGKSLTIFAHAQNAGIVVGAKVPIVLTSRADTARTKLLSLALATRVGQMK